MVKKPALWLCFFPLFSFSFFRKLVCHGIVLVQHGLEKDDEFRNHIQLLMRTLRTHILKRETKSIFQLLKYIKGNKKNEVIIR